MTHNSSLISPPKIRNLASEYADTPGCQIYEADRASDPLIINAFSHHHPRPTPFFPVFGDGVVIITYALSTMHSPAQRTNNRD